MAPCYGPGCCDIGTSWDESVKKCIPGAGGRVSGTAVWAPTTSTLTINLTTPAGVATNEKVIITLPMGVFSGSPQLGSVSQSDYSGSPSLSGSFELTKITNNIAANGSTTITISGLSISSSAYSMSKQLKVKTTKDINDVGINITGISS